MSAPVIEATDVFVEHETAPGSSAYVLDERLLVERLELRSDTALSEAVLTVRLDDDFDFLAARTHYHSDLRLVIRTPAGPVFEGYPQRQVSRREGSPASRKDVYKLHAVSAYARLAQDECVWIYGRRMRNAAILDGLAADPDAYRNRSVLVGALPAVFNADGKPNRAADPLTVTDIQGKARRVYVFAGDGASGAAHWSLADALRYLLWFYGLPEGPVFLDELFDATESLVGLVVAPGAAFNAPSMLAERLRQPASDLEVEATNLVEAVALLADAAGLYATCVTEDVNGQCRSKLMLWVPEDGRERSMALAWGGRYADGVQRYDISQVAAADVFEDNTLSAVELAFDDSAIITALVVVGDVQRWEVTVPLVPGWQPEALLDNVEPLDRPGAKLEAITPDTVDLLGDDAELVPWFRKYHRHGSEFAEHRDVARLWVLNEDGAYDGATYNRNAPFDNYSPFDFASVIDALAPGAWTRGLRPMQSALTLTEDGSSVGVYVEVSYDSGANWHPAVGSIRVLDDRAGVWLGINNPTAMIEPGGDWYAQNMWIALIEQTFRLRATAVFDGDARLVARARASAQHTPSDFARTQLRYAPGRFALERRRGTTNVLASADPSGTDMERDDTAAAEAEAQGMLDAAAAGQIKAMLTVPWLETGLAIGERVADVGRRGVTLNGTPRALGQHPAMWAIWGKRFEFAEDGVTTRLELVRAVGSG